MDDRKEYSLLQVDIVKFSNEDVITTSAFGNIMDDLLFGKDPDIYWDEVFGKE